MPELRAGVHRVGESTAPWLGPLGQLPQMPGPAPRPHPTEMITPTVCAQPGCPEVAERYGRCPTHPLVERRRRHESTLACRCATPGGAGPRRWTLRGVRWRGRRCPPRAPARRRWARHPGQPGGAVRGQSRRQNFGVGAKIAAGSRDPHGLEYRSWHDGHGALVCFMRHPDGRWGLQPQTWSDGRTDFRGGSIEHDEPSALLGQRHGARVVHVVLYLEPRVDEDRLEADPRAHSAAPGPRAAAVAALGPGIRGPHAARTSVSSRNAPRAPTARHAERPSAGGSPPTWRSTA